MNSYSADQLDRLEREVKDLAREVQWEKSRVVHLEEIINRDVEKEQELSREITNLSRDTLEWKEREQFLHGAIESSYKTLQVLQKTEVEGKTKLLEEVKKTDDLMNSMKSRFEVFEKKYNEEMEIIRKLPGFVERKEIEEKKEKLAGIVEENKKLLDAIEERKDGRRMKWKRFQKSCILLAEKGKEAKEKFRELKASKAALKSNSKEPEVASAEDMEVDDQVDEMDTAELNSTAPDEELEKGISSPEKEPEVSEERLSPRENLNLPSSEKSLIQHDAVKVPTSKEHLSIDIPIQDGESSGSKEKLTAPSKPKSRFTLGGSIFSSLRKGLGGRTNSPRNKGNLGPRQESSDVEMDPSEESPSMMSPPHSENISPEPQLNIPLPPPPTSGQTFQLKSLKKFQKKKTAQDLHRPRAEAAAGGDGERAPALSQTKKQEVPLSPPSDVSQPRPELVEGKVEAANRRSLDQLHLPEYPNRNSSDLALSRPKGETGQKLTQKSLTLPKLAVSARAPVCKVVPVKESLALAPVVKVVPVKESPKLSLSVARPRTNIKPLPKIAALQKPLGLEGSQSQSQVFSAKKKMTPTLPTLNSRQLLKTEETVARPANVTPERQKEGDAETVRVASPQVNSPEKTDPMTTDDIEVEEAALEKFSSPLKESQ